MKATGPPELASTAVAAASPDQRRRTRSTWAWAEWSAASHPGQGDATTVPGRATMAPGTEELITEEGFMVRPNVGETCTLKVENAR